MAAGSVLALLCCLLIGLSSAKVIELDNNGRYNDVLISVSDDIAEDWNLVSKLKDAFQEASERLAVATRINGSRSFSFGQVFILVPRSWSNASVDQSVTWQSEDVAHFRVGQRGNPIPHTIQPQGCGKPGLHVNLHGTHLQSTSTSDLGKQLVHEFAHLRYGVFDEYNGPEGPHSYLENGRLQPVRCARTIKGKFGHKDTGLPCRVDRATLQLEPDCRYIEDNQGQTALGSLMYSTYMTSVRQFCSTPIGNPDLDHNPAAPNPQNRRCGGRSIQSVMLDHPDYRRVIDGRETDTTVNFTVVQRRETRRLVIIMDVSGSMQGDPLAKMKIAVRTLLLGLLEEGINCGMLSFNHAVQTLRRMAPLTNSTNRQDYWSVVSRLVAGGNTAIGDSLVVGMEMLGANINSPSKQTTGYIILLTDGQENTANRLNLVAATAVAARTSIVVDTVAFGNSADKRLADLSAATGGKAYFARFNSPANDLMEAMSDMVRDRVPTSQKPIDVFSSPVAATFTQAVTIDASISNAAQFTLSSPNVADITRTELEVISPSGIVYSKLNVSAYLRDDNAGILTISTDGKIESGDWTVKGFPRTLRKKRDTQTLLTTTKLSLVVTSKATDAAPIILDGSISDAKVVLRADTQLSVYATMMQGSTLLSGANITAYVESDSSVEAVLPLLDDGVGADAVKSDGVYSAFVPTTVNRTQEYNVRLVSTSPASRVSTAGKFLITSVDQGSLDKTPPAQIGDLRAIINISSQSSADDSSVKVGFTAVGARRMEGEASRYIVWMCSNSNDLLTGANRTCLNRRLDVPSVKAGSPVETGVPAEALAEFSGTIYLGVIAVNSVGVQSALSNMVSVQTRVPDNIEEVERLGETGRGGLPVIAIVFIAIGVVLAVGIFVGVGIYFILKKRNSTVV